MPVVEHAPSRRPGLNPVRPGRGRGRRRHLDGPIADTAFVPCAKPASSPHDATAGSSTTGSPRASPTSAVHLDEEDLSHVRSGFHRWRTAIARSMTCASPGPWSSELGSIIARSGSSAASGSSSPPVGKPTRVWPDRWRGTRRWACPRQRDDRFGVRLFSCKGSSRRRTSTSWSGRGRADPPEVRRHQDGARPARRFHATIAAGGHAVWTHLRCLRGSCRPHG